jgi:uncharacterized protein YdeI (YjbR/CyaY-like superfamily)
MEQTVSERDPREVPVPDELRRALDADPVARAAWEHLPPSHRREHAKAVADAKKPETRERRVAAALAKLKA